MIMDKIIFVVVATFYVCNIKMIRDKRTTIIFNSVTTAYVLIVHCTCRTACNIVNLYAYVYIYACTLLNLHELCSSYKCIHPIHKLYLVFYVSIYVAICTIAHNDLHQY